MQSYRIIEKVPNERGLYAVQGQIRLWRDPGTGDVVCDYLFNDAHPEGRGRGFIDPEKAERKYGFEWLRNPDGTFEL